VYDSYGNPKHRIHRPQPESSSSQHAGTSNSGFTSNAAPTRPVTGHPPHGSRSHHNRNDGLSPESHSDCEADDEAIVEACIGGTLTRSSQSRGGRGGRGGHGGHPRPGPPSQPQGSEFTELDGYKHVYLINRAALGGPFDTSLLEPYDTALGRPSNWWTFEDVKNLEKYPITDFSGKKGDEFYCKKCHSRKIRVYTKSMPLMFEHLSKEHGVVQFPDRYWREEGDNKKKHVRRKTRGRKH